MILAKSVLADFISELDSNILIILYGLILESLDKVIKKAKMIKMCQKNAAEVIQYNAKMTQLE